MTPFFTLQIWPSLGTWVAWPGDALLRVGREYVKVHAAGGSRFRKDLNSQNKIYPTLKKNLISQKALAELIVNAAGRYLLDTLK